MQESARVSAGMRKRLVDPQPWWQPLCRPTADDSISAGQKPVENVRRHEVPGRGSRVEGSGEPEWRTVGRPAGDRLEVWLAARGQGCGTQRKEERLPGERNHPRAPRSGAEARRG